MYTGEALNSVAQPCHSRSPELSQQHARKLAVEMKIVEQAREESRKEVAALEQMKQHARAAFLSDGAGSEEEFERCWPELRNQIFRQRAKAAAQEFGIHVRQCTDKARLN